jgi:NAD(P)-dependent dehydrogenase (short-subunit alcohol dehydrogenase family)
VNKTAVLVTGATSGIGKATAIHLASRGYTVFAGAYRASDQALADLGAAPSSRGRLQIIEIDVTNAQSIQRACSQIEGLLPDGWSFALVNNAGVAFGSPLEVEKLEKMRLQMEVNYFGVVQVVRCFLPLLRRANGRIINIGSISGKSSMPFNGSYCASKFALEAFADALRLELRPWQIHVSNILPGDIRTEIWEKALQEEALPGDSWVHEGAGEGDCWIQPTGRCQDGCPSDSRQAPARSLVRWQTGLVLLRAREAADPHQGSADRQSSALKTKGC